MNALLGIDVGTTSTKAILFDTMGVELARFISDPYRSQTPNPGWVEQNPEDLWQALLTAVRGLMAKVDADVHIKALCMAVQSGSLLPVDDKGEPVYPLITWMDHRTDELVNQWREEGIEEQIKGTSGWSLYPGLCLLTIAWLREHNPAVFTAATHFLSLNDFITLRLTGKYSTNPSNAGGMALMDIRRGRWSDALCSLAGITEDQLSPVQPSGTVIGEIRPEICRAAGLMPGTTLVSGGHDQGCTALGLGINSPGKLLLACGTAWVITGVTDSPDMDHLPGSLEMNFHPAPRRWTLSQSLGGLGASLEWWINQSWLSTIVNTSRKEAYSALNDALAQTKPGGGGLFFLPLIGGHMEQRSARNGGFLGLQLSHTRADMARAIMEGAAFELRWALEAVQGAGLPVERLWMVGGAANSSLWPEILASVTDVPIRVPGYDNWPALGAAILAGMGVGLVGSIEDGLSHFRRMSRAVQPNQELRTQYDDGYAIYKEYAEQNRH